jgi:hypothetical protein
MTSAMLPPPITDAGQEDVPSIREKAQHAAQQAGVDTTSIERLPFDLSALEDDGILVDVDVRNFGLLDRRLEWQALGIRLPRGTDLGFRPPRCGIVPDRYRLPIVRPAAQAHAALHRFSYRFRLVETVLETTAYRWIPWRAWPPFEQAFEAAQSQLRTALSDRSGSHIGMVAEQLLRSAAATRTHPLEHELPRSSNSEPLGTVAYPRATLAGGPDG